MTGQDTVEVERKYEVEQGAPLPELAMLAGVDRVGAPEEEDLDAVYFDTGDLTLAAQGITLRRRSGGDDAGWHLKLPLGPGERREMTEPVGSDPDSAPERLRRLVLVHTRDRVLVPVAQLSTRRTVLSLYGPANTVLADFCDDRVDARTFLGTPESSSWREWEIELVDGRPDLLDAADTLLAGSGQHPAALPSKLARALGASYPDTPAPPPKPTRKGPASAVLMAYMHALLQALKTHDPGVREDLPDAVHQLRVAARSMRSALATYGKLTDLTVARSLREELKWLAGAVGAARDTEVILQRLRDMIGAEPTELLVGPVQQRIEEHLGARHHDARAAGLAALDSDRYFRLLDSLDSFVTNPPLSDRARKPAGKCVADRVAADRSRLKHAVDAVDGAQEGAPADAALHEVRKSAKRLRYAAEAAAAIHGKRARRLARAAEHVQQVLGEHQDSLVTREVLRDLGATAPSEGANGFSYGRLHALEQQRGSDSRAQFLLAWAQFRPKSLRRK
ncbi:CYTH and CHAD domain-containing protein [Arthrobacter sp. MMS18-M83]|uniref:CYTH and CHAD domain-containing protein n=1 Tax=Arthrobacter sp. MMS18-M83 TaxID=2996261 RepID=UPI00227B26C4|nr:CYTH and CHAD domain-containing protein [Arthrobacter sp. MMS18-M83]WAH98109.1 CYTH and CHAD domain-containing protein [Arthrobacter sp. MMS18-M83]